MNAAVEPEPPEHHTRHEFGCATCTALDPLLVGLNEINHNDSEERDLIVRLAGGAIDAARFAEREAAGHYAGDTPDDPRCPNCGWGVFAHSCPHALAALSPVAATLALADVAGHSCANHDETLAQAHRKGYAEGQAQARWELTHGEERIAAVEGAAKAVVLAAKKHTPEIAALNGVLARSALGATETEPRLTDPTFDSDDLRHEVLSRDPEY